MTRLEKMRQTLTVYYDDKDLMHDLSHIDRVLFTAQDLLDQSMDEVNEDLLHAGAYVHGLLDMEEDQLDQLLRSVDFNPIECKMIMKIANESRKDAFPMTMEGRYLHDAHMLEGGPAFEFIKSMVTGSLRGQSLHESLDYFEGQLMGKGLCFTEVGIAAYKETLSESRRLFQSLAKAVGYAE